MTTVVFHATKGRLDGFVAEGHSGYAEAGSDIVCAAVSAAAGLTECGINQVLGLNAPVQARERDVYLALTLPGGLGEADEYACQTLLAGMMAYLEALSGEYPDHLSVRLDGDEAKPLHETV